MEDVVSKLWKDKLDIKMSDDWSKPEQHTLDTMRKLIEGLKEDLELGADERLKRDLKKAFSYCIDKSHRLMHIYNMPCTCLPVIYEVCEVKKSAYRAGGQFSGAAEWKARQVACSLRLAKEGIAVCSWRDDKDKPLSTNWVTE